MPDGKEIIIMKTRILLSLTLMSSFALAIACGGAATNVSNTNKTNTAANTSNSTNMMSNTASNTMSNTTNSMSNSPSNMAANKPANTAANTMSTKPAANTAANAPANKVATTQKPPKGATAVCKDGTYSFSKTASGQCSGHGGVDKTL